MRTERISADQAQELRKDQMREDRVVKASGAPSSWDAATRSARFVMSSQAKDRMGDVVVTAGLDLSRFEQNPVGLLSHGASVWPIGDWKNIEKILRGRPPRMEGDLVLHKAGGPIPEVDQSAWMIENGYMRGASIGFIPDWNEIEKVLGEDGSWAGGLQFNKAEVVETSLCGIPANPEALAKMADGNITMAREWVEDVLDNWARSPEGAIMARCEFEEAYRVLKADEISRLTQVDDKTADELVEQRLAATNRVAIGRERLTAFERTERQMRLAKSRERTIQVIRTRGV